ncbi:hypothetical protein D3C78_291610 [compost metagenome]
MIAGQALQHLAQGLFAHQHLLPGPCLLQARGIHCLQRLHARGTELHLLPGTHRLGAGAAAHFGARLDHHQARAIAQALHYEARAQRANTAVLGDHLEWPSGVLGHFHEDLATDQAQGAGLCIELQVDRRTALQADAAAVRQLLAAPLASARAQIGHQVGWRIMLEQRRGRQQQCQADGQRLECVLAGACCRHPLQGSAGRGTRQLAQRREATLQALHGVQVFVGFSQPGAERLLVGSARLIVQAHQPFGSLAQYRGAG